MCHNFVQMALFIPFKLIMETESASIYETFKREFDKLVEGTLSLPINIPGTSYHHGFQVYSPNFCLALPSFLLVSELEAN